MKSNDLGLSIWELADAPSIPGAIEALAGSLPPMLVLQFASVSDRTSKLRAVAVTLVEGQLCYLRDASRYERWTGSAWDPLVYVGPRVWQFDRAGTAESDVIGANTTGFLVGGTITNAPPGEYVVTATSTLNCDVAGAVSSGLLNLLLSAGSATPVDYANQLIGVNNLSQPYTVPVRYAHPGGNLVVSTGYTPSNHPTGAVVNNTKVWKVGTRIVVAYHGPTAPLA